mmetsp:Transcript_9425/g.18119  ORF Transcript_9425/g.18119 Transcript_9425/m.18119 type:complete len:292 (-) Transcript_9425:1225-2100(-)
MIASPQAERNAKQFDLLQAIEDTVQEMLEKKEQKPVLYIPYRFMEVYNSPEMVDLLKAILDYCTDLFKLEYKLEVLSNEAKTKNLPAPKPLPSELRRLQEKAQEMARKYGWIIITFKKSKNKQEDQNLYETILYFMHKTLSSAFDRNDSVKLEEELSRLFRSTAFNISLRKQADMEQQKLPPVKQMSQSEKEESIIKRIENKRRISRNRIAERSLSQVMRPGFVRLSPFKAIEARSPLISLILPSPRDKIRQYEQERKNKILAKASNKITQAEAKEILREEMKRVQLDNGN